MMRLPRKSRVSKGFICGLGGGGGGGGGIYLCINYRHTKFVAGPRRDCSDIILKSAAMCDTMTRQF